MMPRAPLAAGRPRHNMDVDVDERIFRCWQNGNSIGETRVQCRYNGTPATFEEVHLCFVDLSHRLG